MEITTVQVKELREKSGAGIGDVKTALVQCNGNMDRAMEYLRQKGIVSTERRANRIASEGVVSSYIHNNKIGVLVEVNCETDFVAKNEDFQQMVKDVCLHIASASPEYVTKEDIPVSVLEEEKRIEMGKEDIIKKPENMREKIVQGRVDKLMKRRVLMEQPFVKDPTKTIEMYIKEKSSTIGEKITIRRFTLYVLGDGLEKRTNDLAKDVMEQLK